MILRKKFTGSYFWSILKFSIKVESKFFFLGSFSLVEYFLLNCAFLFLLFSFLSLTDYDYVVDDDTNLTRLVASKDLSVYFVYDPINSSPHTFYASKKPPIVPITSSKLSVFRLI